MVSTHWHGIKTRIARGLVLLVTAIAALGVLPLPEAASADHGPPPSVPRWVDRDPTGLTTAVDSYQVCLHAADQHNTDDPVEAERATVRIAAGIGAISHALTDVTQQPAGDVSPRPDRRRARRRSSL